MPTPNVYSFSDFEFSTFEDDPEPVIRPNIILESQTRLLERQQVKMPLGTEKIKFTGNHTCK